MKVDMLSFLIMSFLMQLYARMVQFVCTVVLIVISEDMVEYRFVLTAHGVLYVTTFGMIMMPVWYAAHLDIHLMVNCSRIDHTQLSLYFRCCSYN